MSHIVTELTAQQDKMSNTLKQIERLSDRVIAYNYVPYESLSQEDRDDLDSSSQALTRLYALLSYQAQLICKMIEWSSQDNALNRIYSREEKRVQMLSQQYASLLKEEETFDLEPLKLFDSVLLELEALSILQKKIKRTKIFLTSSQERLSRLEKMRWKRFRDTHKIDF